MSSLYKRFHRGIFRDYREVLRLYSLQRMFNAIFHKGKEKGARRRRGGGGGGGKKGRRRRRRRKKKAVDADLYVVLAAFIFSGFYSKPYLHSHYFFASLSLKFL